MEIKKKKIKLVTFAPHPNFGTCLQSYALNKVLTDMGHDVEFIYNGREKPSKGILFYIKKKIKQMIKASLPSSIVKDIQQKNLKKIEAQKNLPPNILILPDSRFRFFLSRLPFYNSIYKFLKCRTLQWKKVWKFTFEDGNYHMKRLYCKEQYDEVVADADLFITGSDQIWNPYCGGFNPMMFLEFAGDKKRVSYSSSISRPNFPKEVEERVKNDLSRFQYIAVREKKSVELLKEMLGRDDIQLVVDPTYLLSTEEWMEFGNRAKIEFELPERYIFCYFIGITRKDEYNEMVENVKKHTGIQQVISIDCIGSNYNYGKGVVYKDGGPYEFIHLLSHASYVCMDSFHATVFSLKFHKDFVHMLKSKNDSSATSQNSRMYDMLNHYNLDYKLYDAATSDWQQPVDFKKVDIIIDEEIKHSIAFLKMELC